MSIRDDSELVEEVKRGNHSAFDLLMDQHQNKIVGKVILVRDGFTTAEYGLSPFKSNLKPIKS